MNFSISEIKEIISTISVYENMDYNGYLVSFLKRRFSKIFELFNIKRISQFYEHLEDKGFRDRVIGEVFVEATEMFRDPAFWRFLRDNVLNLLPLESTIWFPDENSGEGVYSLAIILHEKKLADKIHILCNNPSNYCCNNIKKGLSLLKKFEQNSSNYKRLENLDLFNNYVLIDENQPVSPVLQKNIKCKNVHYTKAVDNEKISMIFARNKALYFDNNYSEEYFNFLYEKLMHGGFLVIGIKEKLPTIIENKLYEVSASEKIYKKI